ncbi:pseudouridine synthase, partial [Mesorhizobium sp. M00.F.Ca.ET.158.01.1.1]
MAARPPPPARPPAGKPRSAGPPCVSLNRA